jgi:hypothetical protein
VTAAQHQRAWQSCNGVVRRYTPGPRKRGFYGDHMCRSRYECDGGRRCPSHTNQILKRLASAVQRVTRWEGRAHSAEAAADDASLTHAMERFMAALADVEERSGWDPEWATVPPPSRWREFTPDLLADTSDDALEAEWVRLHNDPRSQQLIEGEWERRGLARQAELQRSAERAKTLTAFTPELLAKLDDDELVQLWTRCDGDRELQELVEREQDQRIDDGQACIAALTGDQLRELEWAHANLSAAKYIEVERRILTDPSLWSSIDSLAGRETVQLRQEKVRSQYCEFQFERYVDAEDHCRGHLLNKRGRALQLDPYSLMFGNALRMQAYASDEFKAYIGGTGGHLSFDRYRALRGDSSAGNNSVHSGETFHDVAV